MVVKTYGLFDKKAKNFTRTFTSENDETAERAAKYIVREKNFDVITGKDLVVMHMYDFETKTGQIVDNDVHEVCNLEEAYEEFLKEQEKHGEAN